MSNCDICQLSKVVKSPFLKGVGESFIPKVVFVLPTPDRAADNQSSCKFDEKVIFLLKNLTKDQIKNSYFTYLVKCAPFDDTILKSGERNPLKSEIDNCLTILMDELNSFKEVIIVPLGEIILTALQESHNGILQEAGKVRKNKNDLRILPNFDINSVKSNPRLLSDFKLNINLAFSDDIDKADESSYKILNPEDSIDYMNTSMRKFKENLIDYIIYDSETSVSLAPWGGGELTMFSLCNELDVEGYAIPLLINNMIHHKDLPYDIPLIDFEVSPKQRQQLLLKAGELLRLIPIVGHNLKYDLKWAIWFKIVTSTNVTIKDDTFIMAFQYFGKILGHSLKLKDLTRRYCSVPDNWEFVIEDYLKRFRLVKDRHYGNLPTGLLGPYAAKDSFYNRSLYRYLRTRLPKEMNFVVEMLTNATNVFAESEVKGASVDKDMFEFISNSYRTEKQKIRNSIYNLPVVNKIIENRMPALQAINTKKRKPVIEEDLRAGAFSITSGKDLIEIIYSKDYYNIPVNNNFLTKKGKPQTSKDALNFFLDNYLSIITIQNIKKHAEEKFKNLSGEDLQRQRNSLQIFLKKLVEVRSFISELLRSKRIEKLESTYIKPIPLVSHDGVYPPEYNLCGTITGRISSGFHTLPNECDIKRLYDSRWKENGGLFLAPDYSQLELRVGASLSGETKLIEAYKTKLDAHKVTGQQIYGVSIDQVTGAMRKVGKVTNFAVFYGKSAANLAIDLGKSLEEAQKILDGFFLGYDKLTKWMRREEAYALKHKCIWTVWGRKIPIVEAYRSDRGSISRAKRLAVNYPTQSSAADIVTKAVVDLWKEMKRRKNYNSIILGTVHDSIESDVYPGELFQLLLMLQKYAIDDMKNIPWISCPLELSMEIGANWGGALESEIRELSETRVVLKSKGLRRDFLELVKVAKRAYKINLQDIEKTILPDNYFSDDVFVRDTEQWEGIIVIGKKI